MIITKQAKWARVAVHRGMRICRRVDGSGTSQGKWLAGGTYFDTKRAAITYLDSIPEDTLATYRKAQGIA